MEKTNREQCFHRPIDRKRRTYPPLDGMRYVEEAAAIAAGLGLAVHPLTDPWVSRPVP